MFASIAISGQINSGRAERGPPLASPYGGRRSPGGCLHLEGAAPAAPVCAGRPTDDVCQYRDFETDQQRPRGARPSISATVCVWRAPLLRRLVLLEGAAPAAPVCTDRPAHNIHGHRQSTKINNASQINGTSQDQQRPRGARPSIAVAVWRAPPPPRVFAFGGRRSCGACSHRQARPQYSRVSSIDQDQQREPNQRHEPRSTAAARSAALRGQGRIIAGSPSRLPPSIDSVERVPAAARSIRARRITSPTRSPGANPPNTPGARPRWFEISVNAAGP